MIDVVDDQAFPQSPRPKARTNEKPEGTCKPPRSASGQKADNDCNQDRSKLEEIGQNWQLSRMSKRDQNRDMNQQCREDGKRRSRQARPRRRSGPRTRVA